MNSKQKALEKKKDDKPNYLKKNGETKKSAYGTKQGNFMKVHPLDRK